MELLFKLSGILLVACCAVLLIRKSNPEISLLVSLSAVTTVFALGTTLIVPLTQLLDRTRELYGVGDVYLTPIIKCCAAGLLAKITADLCRDASQSAAASAVEFMGVITALGSALPLIGNMMTVIGEML